MKTKEELFEGNPSTGGIWYKKDGAVREGCGVGFMEGDPQGSSLNNMTVFLSG